MTINNASDREILLNDVKKEMENTITLFISDLQKVRTNRASPLLLNDVYVNSYGTEVPLKKVANITTPEPKLIMVVPFDKTSLPVIEKAILAAGLNLTPINDGKLIRIPIPALTEERRKDIVKQVKHKSEETRIAIRKHRQDGITHAKKSESSWSEDDMTAFKKSIQDLTDAFNKKIDAIFHEKEAEILTI